MSAPDSSKQAESSTMGIGTGTRKHAEGASFPGTPAKSAMPEWYPELLSSVSGHVAAGRRRSIAAVNQQVIQTYWAIGRDILDRQESEGWGSRVIDRLSADLRQQFPEAKGFSPRSLKYMRAFAAAWTLEAIVQQPAAQLPWGHQMVLLDKASNTQARLWYAAAAVEHGWARNVLGHPIQNQPHARPLQGDAPAVGL